MPEDWVRESLRQQGLWCSHSAVVRTYWQWSKERQTKNRQQGAQGSLIHEGYKDYSFWSKQAEDLLWQKSQTFSLMDSRGHTGHRIVLVPFSYWYIDNIYRFIESCKWYILIKKSPLYHDVRIIPTVIMTGCLLTSLTHSKHPAKT